MTILIIGLWADLSTGVSQAHGKQSKAQFGSKSAAEAVYQGRWGTSSAPNKIAANQDITNKRLEQLIGLFKTGKAKVTIVNGSNKEAKNVQTIQTK